MAETVRRHFPNPAASLLSCNDRLRIMRHPRAAQKQFSFALAPRPPTRMKACTEPERTEGQANDCGDSTGACRHG